jgi:hypothetical protein
MYLMEMVASEPRKLLFGRVNSVNVHLYGNSLIKTSTCTESGNNLMRMKL